MAEHEENKRKEEKVWKRVKEFVGKGIIQGRGGS